MDFVGVNIEGDMSGGAGGALHGQQQGGGQQHGQHGQQELGHSESSLLVSHTMLKKMPTLVALGLGTEQVRCRRTRRILSTHAEVWRVGL